MPLLLVFAGVVGGLLAFGLIGIFIGPVVLAVAVALLTASIDSDVVYDVSTELREYGTAGSLGRVCVITSTLEFEP